MTNPGGATVGQYPCCRGTSWPVFIPHTCCLAIFHFLLSFSNLLHSYCSFFSRRLNHFHNLTRIFPLHTVYFHSAKYWLHMFLILSYSRSVSSRLRIVLNSISSWLASFVDSVPGTHYFICDIWSLLHPSHYNLGSNYFSNSLFPELILFIIFVKFYSHVVLLMTWEGCRVWWSVPVSTYGRNSSPALVVSPVSLTSMSHTSQNQPKLPILPTRKFCCQCSWDSFYFCHFLRTPQRGWVSGEIG